MADRRMRRHVENIANALKDLGRRAEYYRQMQDHYIQRTEEVGEDTPMGINFKKEAEYYAGKAEQWG